MANREIPTDILIGQVRSVERIARRLGELEESDELCLREPGFQGHTQISGWQVFIRPKVRAGEGPLTHPAFIVDGGMLGSTAEAAYERLRATLVPLGAGTSEVSRLKAQLARLRSGKAAGE